MLNFLKKDKTKRVDRSIVIPSIETVYYLTWPNKSFWMGNVDTIGPGKIELSIDTYEGSDPTKEQISIIQQLPHDYIYYMVSMVSYLEDKGALSYEEIKEMYCLGVIELAKYNDTILFRLLPTSEARGAYNHDQCFEMVDKVITRYYVD